MGGGTLYSGVKCPPHKCSCVLSFLCKDQQDWEEPGHLKFLNASSRESWKQFRLSRPYEHSRGGGAIYPRVKCPPPNPHVCFHFYVMIKGIEKSLVIWSFWMHFKRILKTISHLVPMTRSEYTCGRGGHSFLCDDQKEWEEPGHLKFLNALQEDAGNNFSYLVPVNIVSRGKGGNLPWGKVSPPRSTQPSWCMLSFLILNKESWLKTYMYMINTNMQLSLQN